MMGRRVLALSHAMLGAMALFFGFAAFYAADLGRPYVAIQATVCCMLTLGAILL